MAFVVSTQSLAQLRGNKTQVTLFAKFPDVGNLHWFVKKTETPTVGNEHRVRAAETKK